MSVVDSIDWQIRRSTPSFVTFKFFPVENNLRRNSFIAILRFKIQSGRVESFRIREERERGLLTSFIFYRLKHVRDEQKA